MLPLYVLLVLSAVGYYVSKENPQKLEGNVSINKAERPSMDTLYHSTYVDTANRAIERRNANMFADAQRPKETGVISRNYKLNDESANDTHVASRLAGVDIPLQEFTHNNMTPFYGSKVKQNMRENAFSGFLESYTGVSEFQKPKEEIKSMGDVSKDLGNVYGTYGAYQLTAERMEAGRNFNNTLPFDQVRVGPGVGQGYGDAPVGGFQQDVRDYVRPKTVDDLRVATKPKETFEARMVDGQKTTMRADPIPLNKNRVDTFYESDCSRWFTTTGAVVGNTARPEIEVRCTNRETTSEEHIRPAHANLGGVQQGEYRAPSKQDLGETGPRNAALQNVKAGSKDDYGKTSIQVYANQRDVTRCNTYRGNLTTAIKAIIAPFQDIARTNNKEYLIAPARSFGNMNPQIPAKGTIHDPNDVARVTVRETTLSETALGNLKGSGKLKVHDPNDVARTTVRETTLSETIGGNLKGANQITVYDPNDVARTTIKETLIHDPHSGFIRGPQQVAVYDPDEVARVTVRETLDDVDNGLNLRGHTKNYVYDPDQKARTTMKETLEDAVRDGNLDALAREGIGAYTTTEYEAKLPHKAVLADHEYQGQVYRGAGDGYQIGEFDPRMTQKQFLSDNDYFGISGNGGEQRQRTLEDVKNARINDVKETLLEGRAPTASGVKQSVDKTAIQYEARRQQILDQQRATGNVQRTVLEIPNKEFLPTRTAEKHMYVENDRLDVSLLKPFKENPYTQSLNSVA